MDMKKIIMDIDGTLTYKKKESQNYSEVEPNIEVVKKILEYSKQGYTITLYTSRNMKTYNSNIGLINKNTIPILIDWLDKHSIYYDEIIVGKPWPGEHGFYVDDKTIRPDEFVSLTEKDIYELVGNK
jgi:capsule biosynthesis phosphatase